MKELIHQLRESPTIKTLKSVIKSKGVPEHILHVFTCNCAEWVLKEGNIPKDDEDPSWKAIEVKRKWIEGKASDKDLNIACSDAWEAVWEATWEAAREFAWVAAWEAPWEAAWKTVREAEWTWQCYHLADLMEGYCGERVALVGLLAKRGEQVGSLVEREKQTAEQALFT
jgi:hypothetical protein